MKISKIKDLLKLETLVEFYPDLEVKTACGSDLLSDVLAYSHRKTMLLTGLTNIQVIRTAEMVDLKAIIFVRDKYPEKQTIELARKKRISLYCAAFSLFACCGILYQEGIRPEKINSLN
ncbi:MAG: hypothetical protein ACOCQ1_02475 [Halanaerobiaceae bacterium]